MAIGTWTGASGRQPGLARCRRAAPCPQGHGRAGGARGELAGPAVGARRPGAAPPVGAATMTLPVEWLAAALAALALGLLLAMGGRSLRRRLGLGPGRTLSLDSLTLTSRRYGLTGRVDRLLRQDGALIP